MKISVDHTFGYKNLMSFLIHEFFFPHLPCGFWMSGWKTHIADWYLWVSRLQRRQLSSGSVGQGSLLPQKGKPSKRNPIPFLPVPVLPSAAQHRKSSQTDVRPAGLFPQINLQIRVKYVVANSTRALKTHGSAHRYIFHWIAWVSLRYANQSHYFQFSNMLSCTNLSGPYL